MRSGALRALRADRRAELAGARRAPRRALPAGRHVDGAARIIANKLQEKLGQPFVIENKSNGK